MTPSPFQKRLWYSSLTGLAAVALVACVSLAGYLVIRALAFLQPILTPIAIAAILAFLLDPVVAWLTKKRMPRVMAVVFVFGMVTAGFVIASVSVIPAAYRQGVEFVQSFPQYQQRVQEFTSTQFQRLEQFRQWLLFQREGAQEQDSVAAWTVQAIDQGTNWLKESAPSLAAKAGRFANRSLGGFLGVFGFLVSLILVPIFLFFFLLEGPKIADRWSNYLPMRASPLKRETVALLTEINGYLINFFRGQMLVSLIDGFLTAVFLLIIGLDYALLIGVTVGILGIIPYLGVFISWIPAVLIAVVQFGDWWHPILVTAIFLAVNNLDGLLIAPKIVGESVGLHPLTVIVSVLVWSSVLGGLLGALLAVPLTATLKVVLSRYVWERAPEVRSQPSL